MGDKGQSTVNGHRPVQGRPAADSAPVMTKPPKGPRVPRRRGLGNIDDQAKREQKKQKVLKAPLPPLDQMVGKVAEGKGPNLTGAAAAPDTAAATDDPNKIINDALGPYLKGNSDHYATLFGDEDKVQGTDTADGCVGNCGN